MNEHEAAIKHALRADADIKKLFARMGTADNPRGRVLTAYRAARTAVAAQIRDGDRRGAMATLTDLRATVRDTASDLLGDAVEVGNKQAAGALEIYTLPPPVGAGNDTAIVQNALNAIAVEVDKQAYTLGGLILAGRATPEYAIGDGTRTGVLNAGAVQRAMSFWLATTATAVFAGTVLRATQSTAGGVTAGTTGRQRAWVRQAVCAIDERTTICCLRVNGQTVDLDGGKYHLTGAPRYADFLPAPPFHWYCRTAQAVVLAEMAEDKYTKELREAGAAELDARARTGERVEIHPAHGRSGRG